MVEAYGYCPAQYVGKVQVCKNQWQETELIIRIALSSFQKEQVCRRRCIQVCRRSVDSVVQEEWSLVAEQWLGLQSSVQGVPAGKDPADQWLHYGLQIRNV